MEAAEKANRTEDGVEGFLLRKRIAVGPDRWTFALGGRPGWWLLGGLGMDGRKPNQHPSLPSQTQRLAKPTISPSSPYLVGYHVAPCGLGTERSPESARHNSTHTHTHTHTHMHVSHSSECLLMVWAWRRKVVGDIHRRRRVLSPTSFHPLARDCGVHARNARRVTGRDGLSRLVAWYSPSLSVPTTPYLQTIELDMGGDRLMCP
ncbi:uncharacterized protein LY79DRAFT_363387 [Colletotrichum navitas]|uniref:Uncharacterized protein n=1 Tax=Colletotrichum navitas TaxID=681940 RepID=A0AAD8V0B0_9PEZI|nr:uncharacterized protein LY79DRAFT_363387 [Colletotrichum navitas]KAK1574587.1 hypothetical protein LY79DRAFT_363387 [Colletotrichum navitas]